jgi:hypothetical protein
VTAVFVQASELFTAKQLVQIGSVGAVVDVGHESDPGFVQFECLDDCGFDSGPEEHSIHQHPEGSAFDQVYNPATGNFLVPHILQTKMALLKLGPGINVGELGIHDAPGFVPFIHGTGGREQFPFPPPENPDVPGLRLTLGA